MRNRLFTREDAGRQGAEAHERDLRPAGQQAAAAAVSEQGKVGRLHTPPAHIWLVHLWLPVTYQVGVPHPAHHRRLLPKDTHAEGQFSETLGEALQHVSALAGTA